jgi:hypothetical protein
LAAKGGGVACYNEGFGSRGVVAFEDASIGGESGWVEDVGDVGYDGCGGVGEGCVDVCWDEVRLGDLVKWIHRTFECLVIWQERVADSFVAVVPDHDINGVIEATV